MTKFGLILKKNSKNDKYLPRSKWQARGEAWHRAPEKRSHKNAPPAREPRAARRKIKSLYSNWVLGC